MDLGTYIEQDGRPTVRFERTYAHPIERVWSAITDPDELARWFPSAVRMEPRVGGTVEFSGDPYAEASTGTVLAYDPPRRLAFTWGDDELYFELRQASGGCILTLVDVLESRDAAARNAAGWMICIGELERSLAGELRSGPHSESAEPWQPIYDRHVAAGLPSGAPFPEEPPA